MRVKIDYHTEVMYIADTFVRATLTTRTGPIDLWTVERTTPGLVWEPFFTLQREAAEAPSGWDHCFEEAQKRLLPSAQPQLQEETGLDGFEKTFTSGCFGIGLSRRGAKDPHVCFTVLVEDDGHWFPARNGGSSAWLPGLGECIREALEWLSTNAVGGDHGWTFEPRAPAQSQLQEEISPAETWLWMNKVALASVQRGLSQSAAGNVKPLDLASLPSESPLSPGAERLLEELRVMREGGNAGPHKYTEEEFEEVARELAKTNPLFEAYLSLTPEHRALLEARDGSASGDMPEVSAKAKPHPDDLPHIRNALDELEAGLAQTTSDAELERWAETGQWAGTGQCVLTQPQENTISLHIGKHHITLRPDGSFVTQEGLVNADDLEHGKKLYAAFKGVLSGVVFQHGLLLRCKILLEDTGGGYVRQGKEILADIKALGI